MATKNPFGKTVKKENAYEVWVDARTDFQYLVLKKNQTPEKEALNPFASWEMATRSPYTFGSWELGAGYVKDVKPYARKLSVDEANAFLKKEFGEKAGLTIPA